MSANKNHRTWARSHLLYDHQMHLILRGFEKNSNEVEKMTDKPWLNSYPPGVPATINPDEFHSIVDIFLQSCDKFSERTAFYNMGAELRYADLDYLSLNFAAALQSMGLQQGDRIALMMPNILQYPVAVFGALRAGLVVVNTNPMYTARELRHQLVDSGAKAIV